MGYLLGVDLGTTFTAAAVADGGPPTMVGLGNRALQVPSVLFLAEDGFFVGEAAERRGAIDPDRVVREFKRRLGDHVPVLVDGSPYSAEALMARLLGWVVARTTERMGEPPEQVVLTHPASWGPYKLDLLRQVATLADVPNARWCPEPVAAAAQYATRTRVADGDRLAVYDLGGGTFDVCVLQKTPDGFSILGVPEGIEHLGGVDFDAALFAHVARSLGDRLAALDPADEEVAVALNRLRRDCVEAKEALSSDADTTIPVTLPGLLTSVRVTRSELEELVRPAVEESVRALARALRTADVVPEQLAGIVLVGGSSRIPLVGEMLQREFGVATAVDTHPKHDIALGAVQQGREVRGGAAAPAAAPPRTQVPAPTPVAPAARPAPPPPRVAPPVPLAMVVPAAAPSPPPRSRPPWLLPAAAAVLAAVVVAAVVLTRPDDGAEAGPSLAPPPVTTPTAATSSAPAPTPTPTPVPAVPQSVPLSATQLLVPMAVGGNWGIYLADSTGRTPPKAVTTGKGFESFPVLSPDRRTVVYVRRSRSDSPDATLRVAAAVDGSGDRPLGGGGGAGCEGGFGRPAWNPVDPTVLAAVCARGTGGRLFLVSVTGRKLGEVQTGQGFVSDPAFAPDGRRVAYWAGPAGRFGGGPLYVAAVDGSSAPRQLTRPGKDVDDADPVWSPDGTTIAFRRTTPDGTANRNPDIYTVPADGSTAPRRVTRDAADEQDPSWSPDGTSIAYKSNQGTAEFRGSTVARVWVMRADGSSRHVLVTSSTAGEQTAPAWTAR